MVSFEGARLSVRRPTTADESNGSGDRSSNEAGKDDTLLLLDGLSYDFSKGERVGIVGRNGAGKTSFLRVLVGEEKLTAGWRTVGDTVRFGYYDQRGLKADGKAGRQGVLEFVVSQVKLGVDEKAGDGGEAARLREDFGDAAVGLPRGGAARGAPM